MSIYCILGGIWWPSRATTSTVTTAAELIWSAFLDLLVNGHQAEFCMGPFAHSMFDIPAFSWFCRCQLRRLHRAPSNALTSQFQLLGCNLMQLARSNRVPPRCHLGREPKFETHVSNVTCQQKSRLLNGLDSSRSLIPPDDWDWFRLIDKIFGFWHFVTQYITAGIAPVSNLQPQWLKPIMQGFNGKMMQNVFYLWNT